MHNPQRYAVRRKEKAEYRDWHRFKRIVARLRTRHGYNLTRLSLALGNERTWLRSALDFPYQLNPREYEAARDLLRKETKPMVQVTKGSGGFAPKKQVRILRELAWMARNDFGVKVKDIAAGTGSSEVNLSTWFNDKERGMYQVNADRMLEYLKTVLPTEAVDGAFDKKSNGSKGTAPKHTDLVKDAEVQRRLIRTLRQRGITMVTIGAAIGMAGNSLSMWLHNHEAVLRSDNRAKLWAYLESSLPADLVTQAFSEAGIERATLHSMYNGVVEAAATPAPAVVTETPETTEQPGFTFDGLRAKLEDCRRMFDKLIEPLPARARQVLTTNIGEMIDAAVIELIADETPVQAVA